MKIKIEFYEDDEMMRFVCKDIANDVLDAEGKLAILARQYQKFEDDQKNILGEDADDFNDEERINEKGDTEKENPKEN